MNGTLNGSVTGMNTKNALRMAIKLGCKVWNARKTGEYVIQSPTNKRVRINSRRKDAPKALTTLIGKLIRGDTTELTSEDLQDDTEMEEQADIPEPEETEAEEVHDVNALPEPPDATPEPPAAAAKIPVTNQLRSFREQRQGLLDAANERLGVLKIDRGELAVMLSVIDEEIGDILTELRQLGVTVQQPVQTSETAISNKASLPELAQKAIGFLKANAGVWFNSREITHRIGAPPSVVPITVIRLIEDQLETDGQTRGKLYRVKPYV